MKAAAHARHERRHRISELYLRGMTQHEIAREVGVTQQQVSYDLKVIRRALDKQAVENLDEHRRLELARINDLQREYWQAWQESKEQATKTHAKKVAGGSGGEGRTETTLVKEERTGDPRYLAGVQWCIAERAKILGINAPQRTEVTVTTKPLAEMTDEELDEYERRISTARR